MQYKLLIDGQWVDAGPALEVKNKYNGQVVGTVPTARREDVDAAIAAAERAEDIMAEMPAYKRADILLKAAAILRERAEDMAKTIAAEAGKALKYARAEADRAVSTFTFAAEEAKRLHGETIPLDAAPSGEGYFGFWLRRPVGVIAAISPFNFPLNLVAHKLAPALAAGCAVVVKPASSTPVTALRLAAILEEAGLPAGWLHVLPGSGSEIGGVLAEDDRVRMITFTGSGEVGWGIRQRAHRKKVALELGNASPVLVEADADLELAAQKVATHAFGFAGQTCVSVQRVYVRQEVYEDFVARLIPKVEALRCGDPAEDSTDVGPVIDHENHERVLAWIEEAKAGGATVLTGGGEEHGVIRPTVLADVTPEMRVCREEIFGPVCSVTPYSSLEEGFRLANSTAYGLQSAIFTRSIEPAVKATAALEFGSVMINEAPEWRVDQMPYGGTKASGNTKEGPAYTIREMTEERLVVLGGV